MEAIFDPRYYKVIQTWFSSAVTYMVEDRGVGHPYRFTNTLSGKLTLMNKEDGSAAEQIYARHDLILPYNDFRLLIVDVVDKAITHRYQTYSLHAEGMDAMLDSLLQATFSTTYRKGICLQISGQILTWYNSVKIATDFTYALKRQGELLEGAQ